MARHSHKSTEGAPATPNITLEDVARAAGVALGTASKAINGQGNLRLETRERVRTEARRLGFRFRDLGDASLANRGIMVGLLTTDNYGRFSMPLLQGVEEAFSARPISAFLCQSSDAAREQQHIDLLLARRVDGVIVSARREDPRPPIDIGKAHIPVVYAFTQVADPTALSILPDEAQGAQLAIEHLWEIGRRQFAHITGPADFEAVRARESAMRQTLAGHGLTLPEHRVLSGPWQERWGYTAANFLFDHDSTVDALFCGSDQLARGAIDALRERGVRVPDDVSVVGFDNWEPIATSSRPALTTVDMNLVELGRYAGESLMALISGDMRSGIVRMPCRLIVRESSQVTSQATSQATR
jgi:LacI family transcriptional regulator